MAFDATVKGGESHMTNMGPPGQGASSSSSSNSANQQGRRSTRGNARGVGNGPLSLSNGPLTMSNLGHFPLESPFGLNSDGRPMFNLNSSRDTLLGGLGSNMTDSMRFDFDEVVQHFPSPRAGDRLGSSPGRWDAGINSVTSSGSIGSGIFFPESGYQQQQRRAHSQSSSSQLHASAISHGAQLMAGGTARSESAAAASGARFSGSGLKGDPSQMGASSSSSSAKDKDNVLEKKFKRGMYPILTHS